MSLTEVTSNSILNTISDSYTKTTPEENTGTIGQEAFLTLLVAQMENQDPLNPLDGAEYTAQLAQFSALEQQITTNGYLSEISTRLDENAGCSPLDYIGKQIVYTVESEDATTESTTETGMVDGIAFQDGEVYLTLNGTLVNPDDVVEVQSTDSDT